MRIGDMPDPGDGVGPAYGGAQLPDVDVTLAPEQVTPASWPMPHPLPGPGAIEQAWVAQRGKQNLGGNFEMSCNDGNATRAVDLTLPIPEPIVVYVQANSLALAPDNTDNEVPWAIRVLSGSGGGIIETIYGMTLFGVTIPVRTARLAVDVIVQGGRTAQRLGFGVVVGRGIATHWMPAGDSEIFAAAGTVSLRVPFAATRLTVSTTGSPALVHALDLLGNDIFNQYPVAVNTTQVFSIPRQAVDLQIEVAAAANVWWGWEATT